jgi:hypothetical protein
MIIQTLSHQMKLNKHKNITKKKKTIKQNKILTYLNESSFHDTSINYHH